MKKEKVRKTEPLSLKIHIIFLVIHIITERYPHFVDNFSSYIIYMTTASCTVPGRKNFMKSSVLLDFTGFIAYNQN